MKRFHRRKGPSSISSWASGFLAMVSIHLLLAAALAGSTQAQTFQVLHSFAGADGIDPYDGLTIDAAGHLYGNTIGADNCYVGCGTVYKLSR